jgi:hypothetical protein
VVKVNNNQRRKRKECFISNKYSNFQPLVDSVGGIEEVFEEEYKRKVVLAPIR